MRGGRLAVLALTVLLRLLFLDHPIQGDDVYYLYAAQHAQIDPLHPNHARYLFSGDVVTMQGHPHPPLNGWILGGLLALFGDVYERPFHAVYIAFSLIAAASMWVLARRYSPYPLAATLLFLATPAFVINGNSLESDVPFLAFWLAGIAAFISNRLALSALALALAAMTAFQSVVAIPILWVYTWLHHRRSRARWLVAMTPAVVIGAWQFAEKLSSDELPAAVLAGYFATYNLQSLINKLLNAGALVAHLGWSVFPLIAVAAAWWWPASLAAAGFVFLDLNPLYWLSAMIGVLLLAWCVRRLRSDSFLCAWVLLFFAAALVLFFAGSARYLLPLAAPVALLVSRCVRRRWLYAGFGIQLAISLCLAMANYQHWDAYRKFAASMNTEQRVWVNGEWGLRFYLESKGALPLERGKPVSPRDIVVSSELSDPVSFSTGGGLLAPLQTIEVRPAMPLRLIGLESRTAYSTARRGLRPFDIGTGLVDRVRVEQVVERKPQLSYLPMNSSEAPAQIVSGIYELESASRWMADRATVLLKAPAAPSAVTATVYVPKGAPARRLSIALDGTMIAEQQFAGEGLYTLRSRPIHPQGESALITLTVDRTFTSPGDHRKLGIVLSALGFDPSAGR